MPDTIGDLVTYRGLAGTLGDQEGDYDLPTRGQNYLGSGDQEGDYPLPTNPQTPGAFGNIFNQLAQAYNNAGLGGALGGLFSGGVGGQLGQLAAFGGLAALLNKMMGQQSQQPVGYQGGIPTYTATRTQTPMAVQRPAGYRPGQGGITYFTPVQYTRGSTAPAVDTDTKQVIPRVEDQTTAAAAGGYMPGGIAMLAGGRYLRGPGDGVSDSIPAKFEKSGQPARLADGEFVIDARTVSEIGNGSSEAGARKLYAMMDRVHKARKTAKRGKPSGADRELTKLA